ncbi:MAG: hypothetical protein AAFR56_10880 [Chloroflexota bacterium]
MKGRIAWDNDDRTLLKLTITEVFTIRDFSEFLDGVRAFVAQVKHDVDVMVVMEVAEMPTGFLALMQKFDRELPDNINRTVIVGGNQMFFKMARDFMLWFRPTDHLKNRSFLCETEADAYALLDSSQSAQAT